MSIEGTDKGIGGAELQQSQAGGATGVEQGSRGQQQGSQPLGGGAAGGDLEQSGGSSGTGGYGKDQNSQSQQGQEGAVVRSQSPQQSRGEAFDEAQGGGRSADSVSRDDEAEGQGGGASSGEVSGSDELLRDQAEHQDRGQGSIGSDEDGAA